MLSRCLSNVARGTQTANAIAVGNGSVRWCTTVEGHKSPEYHRHSTRYNYTDRRTLEELDKNWVGAEHTKPETLSDRLAFKTVKFLRVASDKYFKDRLIQRACMLETIAAVPGLVAGFHHHLRSLRKMKHSHWIKPVMDEAENERMHLMTFMHIIRPNLFQRFLITSGQAFFLCVYSFLYAVFPKFSHRFVGYLEEEAVFTYTKMLKYVDDGKIQNFKAPDIAVNYWNMPTDAKLRDVILVIRADEADHKLVNHYMSDAISRLGRDHACDQMEVSVDSHSTSPHVKH